MSDASAQWPLDRAARAHLVARASRPVAPAVHRALVAQNAALPASPARDAHVEALGRGAAAIVTGQQVGLFLGPLYTIYKAASAVVIARLLAAETGAPVVPVFWLQTEDHDLPEIASLGVPGASTCEAITAPIDADNRISIAHLTLPPEVTGCLDRLAGVLGEGGLAAAHLDRLRRHYRPGAPWASAFAGVLAELFAPEGLVMIDPRDPALAAAAAPIHARAIERAEPIAVAMIARCGELERAGRAVPVHVRPGAPLSFFHPDGALGPRVRLAPVPGGFAEVGSGRVHARDALLAALAGDPRRFSTSALL
ncbi:MAG TPA: bacillithiol biosynthesis BshC, partial [Kofleriaceae bacterium]|nr:bacillithiol biosynthesis BshC [Kofleriaceae bacterium]